ncbi:succinyldiaminopimelate transaminase [Frigoribacterium sp. NBH87]|uniref:succinyldiaminopimelate transaminase n=1 Tax=Frigoribacterium sp. NBH87 TaxID=2596916 RepID=UPI00162A476D|nr:succinyldiaminopimelate transaminase [Frigoribacterium sp. NBH87]QNE43235.1 succinyldiaminopimelate transaminase [Frigoribacterium sp. NBH87]
MALDLPDFPWDSLAAHAATARAHEGGIVDLSVGSPVDPTPEVVREALVAATDAHAYPQVAGTPALRAAIAEWYERRRGVPGLTDAEVLPTIGSKELIAGLALWLGLGRGDTIVHPRAAYPTYALGAALVGADVLASDDPGEWPGSTRLVWLNSPGNPDGAVLDVEQLRAAVERARELGAVIAGDECYAELGWEGEWADRPTPSILDPRVVGDDREGVLSVYSLSKQSNLAGYRAGFVAGDAAVVQQLLSVRKHAGLMPPAPVQEAMRAALGDEAHVAAQKELYRSRRDRLAPALRAAGFRIDRSEAGLYLWATRDEPAEASVAWLAERGVLAAPGTFYGVDGGRHVRVALTTTDERIDAAVERLTA